MRLLILIALLAACTVGTIGNTPTPPQTPPPTLPMLTPTITMMQDVTTPTAEHWTATPTGCHLIEYTVLYQDIYLTLPVGEHHHDFAGNSFDHSHLVELFAGTEIIRIEQDIQEPVWWIVTAGDTDSHFGYVAADKLNETCR